MPPGTLVPRDWLVEQLANGGGRQSDADSAAAPGATDLTIADLARLFGKRPSTVRAWVERGDFPGAYKLQGKEWRVPASSIDSFQHFQQQRSRSASGLSAWRSVSRNPAARRPASGQQEVTQRPPAGNAED
jgi:hypothetical protein